jgi:hypothetical protein
MVAIDEIAGAEAGNVIGDDDDSAHRVHARHEGKRWEHAPAGASIVSAIERDTKAGEHLDHCGAGKGRGVGYIFDGKRGRAAVELGCLHGWFLPWCPTPPHHKCSRRGYKHGTATKVGRR